MRSSGTASNHQVGTTRSEVSDWQRFLMRGIVTDTELRSSMTQAMPAVRHPVLEGLVLCWVE